MPMARGLIAKNDNEKTVEDIVHEKFFASIVIVGDGNPSSKSLPPHCDAGVHLPESA
jgi:hypothetical protein